LFAIGLTVFLPAPHPVRFCLRVLLKEALHGFAGHSSAIWGCSKPAGGRLGLVSPAAGEEFTRGILIRTLPHPLPGTRC
jgi:hypothetical protein